MFQIPNWKTVNKLHIFKWLKKNTALKALHSHSLSVEKCTRWCTQKKNPASATTFIFFRKCLCDLALLLILEGGWELDEHFHCPHTRCWRQLLCYRASTWLIIASSEEFPPGQQQIGSQTVSKYHLPKMMLWILIILHLPRQHKWAQAGNKLLNHLPFSEKVIRESLLASRTYKQLYLLSTGSF